MNICRFAIWIAITQPAWAGGVWIGNGGNAIVCRDAAQRIQSAELFDYHREEVDQIGVDLHIDLDSERLSFREKIGIALARLAKFSPMRAKAYQRQADLFLAKAEFVSETLPIQRDLGLGGRASGDSDWRPKLAPNCALEQLAIQSGGVFDDEATLVIQKEIWAQLDETSRAGLILHEVIYREAASFGRHSSGNVRRFNIAIASHYLDGRSLREFLSFLMNSRFIRGEMFGFSFPILMPQLSLRTEHDAPLSRTPWTLDPPDMGYHPTNETPFQGGVQHDGAVLTPYLKIQLSDRCRGVHFYADGSLRRLCGDADASPDLFAGDDGDSLDVISRTHSMRVSQVSLTHNGRLAAVIPLKKHPLRLLVNGHELAFSGKIASAHTPIEFHANEQLASGWLAEHTSLKDAHGNDVMLRAGSFVRFNESGEVVH